MTTRPRALLAAVLLLGVLGGPAVAPALADEGASDAPSDSPSPPAEMSDHGGKLLAKAGTQVQPKAGAPALPKQLTGRSWIVADAKTGEVLAAGNPHWKLAPASTLKMLFADTVLPKFDKNKSYTVKDSDLQGMGEGSSLVGIKEKTPYKVHDLWNGVFLRSGNDAVHVLCAMNGGVPKTVKEMQAKARELGALDTTVRSPDGYDMPGQLSSAYDLTLFARAGLKNKDFRGYAGTPSAQFPGELPKKGKKRESFGIQSTNRLLGGYPGIERYRGIIGVKNGFTTNAGNTFTGAAERGGRTLLVTVMHPEGGHHEVYTESAALLDWGFAAAGKVKPIGTLNTEHAAAGAAKRGEGASGGDAKKSTASKVADSFAWGPGLWITAAMALLLAGAIWYLRGRRRQVAARTAGRVAAGQGAAERSAGGRGSGGSASGRSAAPAAPSRAAGRPQPASGSTAAAVSTAPAAQAAEPIEVVEAPTGFGPPPRMTPTPASGTPVPPDAQEGGTGRTTPSS
jgi:D-alanyl-D-alanine carboxypeptidase (penicillin-binding protein 5/6)